MLCKLLWEKSNGLKMAISGWFGTFSLFPEKFESSSLAQVAFAVAIPSTRYNGGSFGADFSRSKLKCRRRHEQDNRVTCKLVCKASQLLSASQMAQRTTRHTVRTGYISNFENI